MAELCSAHRMSSYWFINCVCFVLCQGTRFVGLCVMLIRKATGNSGGLSCAVTELLAPQSQHVGCSSSLQRPGVSRSKVLQCVAGGLLRSQQ